MTLREQPDCRVSGRQLEQLVDEAILLANISGAKPSCLPLPDHVQRFVSGKGSPGCMEFAKALRGLDAAFDGAMILLENVVQILNRSMTTPAAQRSFRCHCGNRRAVAAGLIGVDHAGLRM